MRYHVQVHYSEGNESLTELKTDDFREARSYASQYKDEYSTACVYDMHSQCVVFKVPKRETK